jgi:RND family efflux transporter MFP subunit
MPSSQRALVALVVLVVLGGCSAREREEFPIAEVAAPRPESELASVTLSALAVKRLGIETARATRRSFPSFRTVPGEVVAVPGGVASLAAPIAGVVSAEGSVVPGRRVAKNERVAQLRPVSVPDADVRAKSDRDVEAAQARAEADRERALRTTLLAEAGVTSVEDAEQARAASDAANAQLKEARKRRARIQRAPLAADVAFSVRAPRSGILQNVDVSPGQVVAEKQHLFDIVPLDRVWIRAAIHPSLIDSVERTAPARVRRLGADQRRVETPAQPVSAPPTADPRSPELKLYFELDNEHAQFFPGERVEVRLVGSQTAEALAVPRSAIVYDIHGGTWVYIVTAPRRFERRRVEVAQISEEGARIERGLAPGVEVVSVGAAELYGAEFRTKK